MLTHFFGLFNLKDDFMKRNIVIFLFFIILVGCGAKKDFIKKQPNTNQEQLLWSSNPNKPKWTAEPPESTKNEIFFIGISKKSKTEKTARMIAKNDIIKNAVNYYAVNVKNQLQNLNTKFGLSSDIINPTEITRGFVNILSKGIISGVKIQKTYLEKWKNQYEEIYYITYMLGSISKDYVKRTFDYAIKNKINNLMIETVDTETKTKLKKILNEL
jgi:hypothetical protein